jgi:hypothetical protein
LLFIYKIDAFHEIVDEKNVPPMTYGIDLSDKVETRGMLTTLYGFHKSRASLFFLENTISGASRIHKTSPHNPHAMVTTPMPPCNVPIAFATLNIVQNHLKMTKMPFKIGIY